MSEQESRGGRLSAVVAIAVTAVVGFGLGWVLAAAFGEPSPQRWSRALGLAVSSTVIAVLTPWIARWRSRREISRGSVLAGLRVVEGVVPGLGSGWTLGKAAVVRGRVDFVCGRVPFRGARGDVTFAVASHGEPRESTFRESLRVGGDARVVDLVTSQGARVRLAAVRPRSLTPMLAALDV